VCYGITNFIDTEELALTSGSAEVAAILGLTKAAALACLMFNLFTPPCFAALGAMNSEIGDRKWFWSGVALQLCTGYVVAFLVYQIGTLITAGTVGTGFLPGLLIVGVMLGIAFYLCAEADKKAALTAKK
jgi:ferrous iron transport protein B